jgi:hypothetical protein
MPRQGFWVFALALRTLRALRGGNRIGLWWPVMMDGSRGLGSEMVWIPAYRKGFVTVVAYGMGRLRGARAIDELSLSCPDCRGRNWVRGWFFGMQLFILPGGEWELPKRATSCGNRITRPRTSNFCEAKS